NSKGSAQYTKRLKVIQVTPQGFLVEHIYSVCTYDYGCQDQRAPFIVFIHKTDEVEIIDESYLDKESDGSLYEYTGPFAYNAILGTKTVRSFKKVPTSSIVDASKDLIFYNPYDELFAETGSWKK